jgi:hypothetical protein
MLQRTVFAINQDATTNIDATTNTDATKNECYNEPYLSIKLGCHNKHRCYNEEML